MSSITYASVTLVRDLEGRLWGIATKQTWRGDVTGLYAFDFTEYSTGITDFHGKVLVDGARAAIRAQVEYCLDVDSVFIVGIVNAIGLAAGPEMLKFAESS
jgi:hypothetical protein